MAHWSLTHGYSQPPQSSVQGNQPESHALRGYSSLPAGERLAYIRTISAGHAWASPPHENRWTYRIPNLNGDIAIVITGSRGGIHAKIAAKLPSHLSTQDFAASSRAVLNTYEAHRASFGSPLLHVLVPKSGDTGTHIRFDDANKRGIVTGMFERAGLLSRNVVPYVRQAHQPHHITNTLTVYPTSKVTFNGVSVSLLELSNGRCLMLARSKGWKECSLDTHQTKSIPNNHRLQCLSHRF